MKNETEQQPDVTTAVEPAVVTYHGRRTKNLGDYNSISIEVGIHIPCDPKDVDKTYEAARDFVASRMKKEMSFADKS